MTQQPYYAPPPPAPQQYTQPPVQQPVQPQYPAYPQQGYQAPAQPQYAPAPPQQPAQPLVAGTLDDFYNQPSSGGGPSLKFPVVNTRYIGIVSRPIGPGDVQQQTDTTGTPLFFKDGRAKFVMKVPLQMQPSPDYPDGIAQWYVKGGARDELSRAMAEAGAPAGAPEPGAILDITFVAERSSGVGRNPAKVFQVRYTRPDEAGATSPAPAPPVAAPVEQQVPQQQPSPVQVPQQAQVAPPAPQQAPVPPAAQQGPVQGAPQPPADLTPEQQQLLAKLQGQS